MPLGLYCPSDYGKMEQRTVHGTIVNDTSGQPAALLIGSYESNGLEPWEIRGEKMWIGVGLARTRVGDTPWCVDKTTSSVGYNVNIPNLPNIGVNSWQLAANNTSVDGTDRFVSDKSTQAHMDGSLNVPTQSKLATDRILAYNANMKAAKHCRTFTLDTYGQMDLPSVDVLMRIYQARDMIDALDPTLSSNPNKALQQGTWGVFGSSGFAGVWSSSPYSTNYAWCVSTNGYVYYGNRYYGYGVVPAIEVPVLATTSAGSEGRSVLGRIASEPIVGQRVTAVIIV